MQRLGSLNQNEYKHSHGQSRFGHQHRSLGENFTANRNVSNTDNAPKRNFVTQKTTDFRRSTHSASGLFINNL